MRLPNRALLLACVGVLALAPALSAAPVELDAPDLVPGVEATTVLHLGVTAGVSGAPNGFTIEWMPRMTFDALGGWPADPRDPAIFSAIYLGSPSLNTVEGTTSFLLGPGQMAMIEIGDIFDETGVLSLHAGEMAVGTEYVVRVSANGDGGLTGGGDGLISPSPYSGTYYAWTKENGGQRDCVHSQGYWKEHPEAWPVSNLRLGNVIYTKTQLLAIWHKPAAGNGLISLSHQLMAAKLNIIGGAIPPSVIVGAITTADALIGARIIPPVGSGFLAPGVTSQLNDDLEEFNTEEGSRDVACHVVTAAKPSTWGALKAIYR